MEKTFFTYGIAEIIKLGTPLLPEPIPRAVKRKRAELLQYLDGLPDAQKLVLADAARQTQGTKRKAKNQGRGTRPKKAKTAASEQLERETHVDALDATSVIASAFLEPVSDEVVKACISRYIDRTGNEALRKAVCMICARRLFMRELELTSVEDLPNKNLLVPSRPHRAQTLTGGCLLHVPALSRAESYACLQCLRKLKDNHRPAYSLANGMWIGEAPFQLSILTLPERLLIALYFPAAYVVKLYPKVQGARVWKKESINTGMKGNVSTYRLNTADIAGLAAGNTMPPSPKILAATIGVTFVGVGTKPLTVLPDFLHVRRQRVFEALLWLKDNNSLYSGINISKEQLQLLPEDDVPEEISLNAKYSDDVASLQREQAGYVPEDAEDEEIAASLARGASGHEDVTMETVGRPSGDQPIEDDTQGLPDEDGLIPQSYDACVFPMLGGTPTPFPLQAMGVVDAHGEGVPDSDLFAHAFSNAAEGVAFKDFGIRKSSAFVNEYPRLDEQNERFDGGPTNPNHMLGAFPVLFPYGFGGIEVDRSETVPYEAHVRWALQYDDSRFRKDFYFIFQAFGVLQKRQVCRSAGMQIKRSSFIANQVAFMKLQPKDFLQASTEETRRVPFSNPVVRTLRKTLTSLRARVQGTDESRISIRSQVWGTNLRFNPATVWATWNMSDTGDPMAQVLVGEEINMDDFIATSGPNRDKRASNIAGDPYAAAEFFHTNVLIILEEMLGIKVVKRGSIQRKEGILGFINAYIATVEAQARGTLHIHILFWVDGAPTAAVMREALQSAAFREKMARFIKQNIRADIKGTDALSVLAMKKESNIAYARPVDPRCENYELLRHATEARVARAVQTHNCTVNTCLRTVDGRLTCKRRAPWALASEDWVEPNGEWGPRRVYGRMNAWNPALLQILHSNQDMKLVTNGHETKDITFYITLYIAKKQIQAANASALLAKSVAMHKKLNRRQTECKDINKRLITQCANTLSRQHEFSGPEVVSYLMGWGDRFISHNFVSIYWDQVTSALRKTFPTLSNRSFLTRVSATMEVEPPVDTVEPEKELTMELQVIDGEFVLKDQLKEFSDRGIALEDMSFYDYFVKTYDGPMLGSKKAADTETNDDVEAEDTPEGDANVEPRRKAGHPGSVRVPYLPEAKRKRCRVLRSAAFETCLQFVGTWFPRSDREDDREYYCANMLALLKPWRKLTDLKCGNESFDTAFGLFLISASDDEKRVVENIQYFHECSDGSERKRQQPATGNGGEIYIDDNVRRAADAQELEDLSVGLTEDDVENARRNRYAAREYVYGMHAVNIAKDIGIFTDERAATCFRPVARRASLDEYVQYQAWGKMVSAMTRSAKYVVDNVAAVAPRDESVLTGTVAPDPEQYAAAVLSLQVEEKAPRTLQQQQAVDMLNAEQRRAHDIIEQHLRRTLNGQPQEQLLMIVRGEGGTGKTVLLNAISQTFDYLESTALLAKTATTGVAASLIGGQTLHSWAGIAVTAKDDPDWTGTAGANIIERRKRNILPAKYLEVDEFSMMTKKLLAQVSQVIGAVRATAGVGMPSQAFGGMNLIIFGDPHQFPPVGNAHGALYCQKDTKTQAQLGLHIYHQFTTVVTLVEQRRITDLPWKNLLQRLRRGACTEGDINDLQDLLVTNDSPTRALPSWDDTPWSNAVLVTPRHGSRMQWNTEAVKKHCARTGNRMYVCRAEDTRGKDALPLDLYQRVVVAGMTTRQTGKLSETVELAVGMRAMVLLNISTEGDLANGTRGEIVDIKLDPREEAIEEDDDGVINLRYPPAVVFFRPDSCSFPPFEGLPAGILPIVPSKMGFTIKARQGGTVSLHRRQLAITPGYAFTDYKSQGQTIEYVLVDLEQPPTSSLTPFSAYVALSRSRGRGTIRLLRGFDTKLFTTHPSEELAAEDARLDQLTVQTKEKYN